MKRGDRGFAVAGYLLIGAIVALGALWLKPKVFHGETKRAQESAETTAKLIEAEHKRSAEAAASVVKIGEANAQTVDSLQKTFIGRETSVALSKLEPPDPTELINAEKRKVAVLEGRLSEANKLYGVAMVNAAELAKERQAALLAKQRSDRELEIVAAEHYASEKTKTQLIIVAGVLVALYVYTKLTHVGIGGIQEAVADMKAGKDGVQAIDGITTRFQQQLSRLITKLKS